MKRFEVIQRDTYHWDIYIGNERVYKIRGEPGNIIILYRPTGHKTFTPTVQSAMSLICDQIMYKPKE